MNADTETNPTTRPLRARAADLLVTHRAKEEETRKRHKEDEDDQTRSDARREAVRAVEAAFGAIDKSLINRVVLLPREERNEYGVLSVSYEMRVEDLRFVVAYEHGGGSAAGIGLRLFDTCPVEGCGACISPRATVRGALSLAYAIELLDEELAACKHDRLVEGDGEYQGHSDSRREPVDPVGSEELIAAAGAAHTAELERKERAAADYTRARAERLGGEVRQILNLAGDPRPGESPVKLDGQELVTACYGDLTFVRLLKHGSDISIVVLCVACGRPTVASENITSRAELGRALVSDGAVDAWHFHPKHGEAPSVDPGVALFVELRSVLKRTLDLDE